MLDAMHRGAEVFKNISCVGSWDIVLMMDGPPIACDVKQKRWNTQANDYTYRGDSNAEHVILVHPRSQKISWYKAPSGWENFWS